MQPHQQRVVDEKTEIDKKLHALEAFRLGAVFGTLPDDEQGRLHIQVAAMQDYSTVLGERIKAFPRKQYMTVELPDGSKWGVPVDMIALNRATHYASEFGDVARSLAEDTVPLFAGDEYEIQDWAVNNMNWSDFGGHQVKIADAPTPDFQTAWLEGRKGYCLAPG